MIKTTDKNGRRLTKFHQTPWMIEIRKKRGYKTQPKGTAHWCVKLTEANVVYIRSFGSVSRALSKFIGRLFKIHPSYVYQIRARKRWRHI